MITLDTKSKEGEREKRFPEGLAENGFNNILEILDKIRKMRLELEEIRLLAKEKSYEALEQLEQMLGHIEEALQFMEIVALDSQTLLPILERIFEMRQTFHDKLTSFLDRHTAFDRLHQGKDQSPGYVRIIEPFVDRSTFTTLLILNTNARILMAEIQRQLSSNKSRS